MSASPSPSASLRNLIEAIPDENWTPIPYWMDGAAAVAETTYSYHGFITDRDGETLELEADHRRHAEIENAIRDLKYGVGLNHMPSGRFAANAAWLAVQVMADNLARWTARIGLGERIVTTKTLRRRFFSLAGRLTRSARRLTLHLPKRWPDCEPFHTQSDQPSGNLPVDPTLTHRPIERPGETPAKLTAGVSSSVSQHRHRRPPPSPSIRDPSQKIASSAPPTPVSPACPRPSVDSGLSFFVPSRQFCLQLPDPGLGCQPGLLFGQPGFPLLLEGGYFPPCPWVAPTEFSVFPPDQETQRGAVALQDSVLNLLDGDWLVLAVHKPVPGQPAPVEVAGLVEPPIFRDAQRRVSGRFVPGVGFAGSP